MTITSGRVTEWRGSNGLPMTILDNPAATATATGAHLAVTVNSSTSGLMSITMELSRSSARLLNGTLTTNSLGHQPFIGTVTMTPG